MKSKIVLTTALALSLSCQVFARDIKPTTGDIAIAVEPTVQNGIEGALVRLCSWNRSNNSYSNCKKIGQREFYTQNEIDSVGSRLAVNKAGEVIMPSFQMASAGAFVGLLIALFTAPPSGGSSLVLFAYVAGSAAVAGTATATVVSQLDERGVKNIRQGVVSDADVSVEVKQFNEAFQTLKTELNSLQ